jgi:hypothetical protein
LEISLAAAPRARAPHARLHPSRLQRSRLTARAAGAQAEGRRGCGWGGVDVSVSKVLVSVDEQALALARALAEQAAELAPAFAPAAPTHDTLGARHAVDALPPPAAQKSTWLSHSAPPRPRREGRAAQRTGALTRRRERRAAPEARDRGVTVAESLLPLLSGRAVVEVDCEGLEVRLAAGGRESCLAALHGRVEACIVAREPRAPAAAGARAAELPWADASGAALAAVEHATLEVLFPRPVPAALAAAAAR